MLLQFNVTNALSFKGEAILDLVAASDTEHKNNLIKFRKEDVLPTIAIYGANAAGKSNLFKALTSAILFVRLSSSMQIGAKISITPFLMDEALQLTSTGYMKSTCMLTNPRALLLFSKGLI